VRTVLETLTGEGDPHLEAMALGPELGVEIDRLEPTYPEVSFDVSVPDGPPVIANELLGDVYRQRPHERYRATTRRPASGSGSR